MSTTTAGRSSPEDEGAFALAYAHVHAGADFAEDLEEAGDDPVQRAVVQLEAELDSYPSR